MRVPAINVNATNTDAIQRRSPGASGNAGSAKYNFIDTAQFKWFLPGSIDKMDTINTVAYEDLLNVDPGSAAARVVSHIGA